MYGLTRGTITLLAAGVAGLLIWLATQIDDGHAGGYWARIGLVRRRRARHGSVPAARRLDEVGLAAPSSAVLLTAFVPVAIASLWVILAAEPSNGWFHSHVLNWSGDISIDGLVTTCSSTSRCSPSGRAGLRVLLRHDRAAGWSPSPTRWLSTTVRRWTTAVADEPLTADAPASVAAEPEPTDADARRSTRITTDHTANRGLGRTRERAAPPLGTPEGRL